MAKSGERRALGPWLPGRARMPRLHGWVENAGRPCRCGPWMATALGSGRCPRAYVLPTQCRAVIPAAPRHVGAPARSQVGGKTRVEERPPRYHLTVICIQGDGNVRGTDRMYSSSCRCPSALATGGTARHAPSPVGPVIRASAASGGARRARLREAATPSSSFRLHGNASGVAEPSPAHAALPPLRFCCT